MKEITMKKIIWMMGLLLLTGSCSRNSSTSNPEVPVVNAETVWHAASGQFVGNLDFGVLGAQASKLLTIKVINDGDTVLSGPPTLSTSDFSLVYHNCDLLAPGKSCQIKILFSSGGKTDGVYSGTLILAGQEATVTAGVNLPEGPSTVQVYLNSLPMESATLDFGVLKYNQSIIKTLTFKNSGVEAINEVVTVQNFQKVYDTCSNRNLGVGQSCQIKVSLSGGNLSGVISGTLQYANQEITLQAEVKTLSQVTADSADFKLLVNSQVQNSSVDLGTLNLQISKIVNFFIKNQGATSGQVSPVAVPSFAQVFANNCDNQILIPGGSCWVKVVVDTADRGVKSSGLSFNDQHYDLSYVVRKPGDKIDCHAGLNLVETADITWDGSNYSSCVVETCAAEAHLGDNECLPNQLNFTVNTLAEGQGEISGPSSVDYGGMATFHYQPGEGYGLLNWGGDCAGTPQGADCVLENVTAPKSIAVTTETLPYHISSSYLPLLTDNQVGQCNPVQLSFTGIDNQAVHTSQDQALKLQLNNTNVVAYSDNTCTTALNTTNGGLTYNFNLPAQSPQTTIYLKSNTTEGVRNLEYQVVATGQTLGENRNFVYPLSCLDALNKKFYNQANLSMADGNYTIKPSGQSSYDVLCDQTSWGGGWTRTYRTNLNANYTDNWSTSSVVDSAVAQPYLNFLVTNTSTVMIKTDKTMNNYTFALVSNDPMIYVFTNGTNLSSPKTTAQLMSGPQIGGASIWTSRWTLDESKLPPNHTGFWADTSQPSNTAYYKDLYFNVFQNGSTCDYGGSHLSMFPAARTGNQGGTNGYELGNVDNWGQTTTGRCQGGFAIYYGKTNANAVLEVYIR
jgi:hypothetical protein